MDIYEKGAAHLNTALPIRHIRPDKNVSFWRNCNPRHFFTALIQHRELLWQFVWWEIQEKYRRTTFGLLWMLFTPLLRLAVYTVVFSFLLGGRSVVWGMESDAGVGLMIFAGLIVFTVFSETLGSAPRLIWSNRSYVKHIPFPIEILPVAMVGASLVQAFFGAGLLMGMTLFFMNGLSVNCLYLPLVFLPLVFFTLGLSWFFSTIGVYWQDINNITQSFIQFMLFLSAIVYPLDRFISVVPQSFVALFRVNPMMTIVEDMRRILLKAMAPDWQWYGITLAGTFLCMLVGYAVFMNAKRNFSDIV